MSVPDRREKALSDPERRAAAGNSAADGPGSSTSHEAIGALLGELDRQMGRLLQQGDLTPAMANHLRALQSLLDDRTRWGVTEAASSVPEGGPPTVSPLQAELLRSFDQLSLQLLNLRLKGYPCDGLITELEQLRNLFTAGLGGRAASPTLRTGEAPRLEHGVPSLTNTPATPDEVSPLSPLPVASAMPLPATVTPAADTTSWSSTWADEEAIDDAQQRRRRLFLSVALLVPIVAAVALIAPRLGLWELAPEPAASPVAVGRVVFQSDRDTPGQPQLYLMSPDGTNVARVPIAIPYAWNPHLSPDGQRIAFIGTVGGVDNIYVVGIDGRNLQPVTSKAGNNRHPAWSPDGQWLAFGSDRTGNWDIYVARPDGSGLRNLTTMATDDNLPTWSPDGLRLAFQSDRSGRMQIHILDVGGRNRPINVSNSVGHDRYPRWSPDGRWLAFYSNRDGNSEIYVIPADGGEARNLTSHPAADELAAWSPDGRSLVFTSDRDGNWELYTITSETGEVRRLSSILAHDSAPDWGRPNDAPSRAR